MELRSRIWVGVDAGKASHHACAVDETGKVAFSCKVANGQRELEALIARAARTGREVSWAVDLTSGGIELLLALLRREGHRVTYVPGQLVSRMAGAFPGEGKTDARDAKTIAETARLRSDLATIKNPDQVVTDLQVLTSRRQDLMADWVRGVNRVRDLLTSVFPGLEQAFDYSTRSALILLTGFQAPAQIRAAGAPSVAAWLREHGAWPRAIDAMAGKAAAAANAQTIALPAETAAAPLIADQASHLLSLDRQIKDLDKQITARVSDHPGARPIISVAGFGPLLAAQLLASTSGDLAATFGNPGRLAAYAGLVPVPKDSGRIHGNLRRPTRYHRVLRRVFYQAALSAIKPDGPSRAYYQRKRAEGKLHTQALLALARRLVDVIWALLRDGREFSCTAPA